MDCFKTDVLFCSNYLVAIDWVKVGQCVVSLLIHHAQFIQYINNALFFVTNNSDDGECTDYLHPFFCLFAMCAPKTLSEILLRAEAEGEKSIISSWTCYYYWPHHTAVCNPTITMHSMLCFEDGISTMEGPRVFWIKTKERRRMFLLQFQEIGYCYSCYNYNCYCTGLPLPSSFIPFI